MSKQIKREIRYITSYGNNNEHYGNVGDPTRMTYKDGGIAHVGDLVAIYANDSKQPSESMVVKDSICSPAFVMGLLSFKENLVRGVFSSIFRIELVKKYYDVEDGYYRGGILKVTTLQKQTEQKKKTSQITVKVKADLLFDRPEVEDINGEDIYIFTGRSVIYVNRLLSEFGMSTCNSNELKSYNKEIGKALAYYRCMNKVRCDE